MLWRRVFSWAVSFTLLLSFLSTSATAVYALKTEAPAEKKAGLEELGKKLQGKTPPNDAGDYLIDGTSTAPAESLPTKGVDPARVIHPPMPSDASFDFDPGYREVATSGLEEKYRPAVVIPAPPGGAEGSGGSTRLAVAVPPSRAARSAGAEMSAPNLPASTGTVPTSSPSVRSELVEERTDRPSTSSGRTLNAADLETSGRPTAVSPNPAQLGETRAGSTVPAVSTAASVQQPARPDDRPFKPFFLPSNPPEPTFLPPTGSEFSSRSPTGPAVPKISSARPEPLPAGRQVAEGRTSPALTLAGLEETWNRADADSWVILRGESAGRELVDLLPAGAQVADLGSSFWLNGSVPTLSPGRVWNILQVQPERHLLAIAPNGQVALLREGELTSIGGIKEALPEGKEWYQQAAARARGVLTEEDLKRTGLQTLLDQGKTLTVSEQFRQGDILVSAVNGKISFKVTADQASPVDAVTLRPIGTDEAVRRIPAVDLRMLYRVVRPTVSTAGLEQGWQIQSVEEALGRAEQTPFGAQVGTLLEIPGELQLRVARVSEAGFSLHSHPFSEHYLAVVAGKAPVQIGEHRGILEPGSYARIPAGTLHGIPPEAGRKDMIVVSAHRIPYVRAEAPELQRAFVASETGIPGHFLSGLSVFPDGKGFPDIDLEVKAFRLNGNAERLVRVQRPSMLFLISGEGRVRSNSLEPKEVKLRANQGLLLSPEQPVTFSADTTLTALLIARGKDVIEGRFQNISLEDLLETTKLYNPRSMELNKGHGFDSVSAVDISEGQAAAAVRTLFRENRVYTRDGARFTVQFTPPAPSGEPLNRPHAVITLFAAGLEETSAEAAARPAAVPAARPETVSPLATGTAGGIHSSYIGTAPAGELTPRAPEAPAVTSTTQRAQPALIVSTAVFSAALQILSPEMRQPDGRSIPVMTVVESPDWIPAVYAQAEQVGLELTQVVSLTEFGGNMDAALRYLQGESLRHGYEPVVARRIADLAGLEEVLGVARPETFRRVVEGLLQEELKQYP